MTENMIKYSVIRSEKFFEDYGTMTTYGVEATNLLNDVPIDIVKINDISIERETAQKFMEICDINDVTLLTLNDVLEDFIS